MSTVLRDLAFEMDCTPNWETPSCAMAEELGNITVIDGPTSARTPKGLCDTIAHLLESALEELTSTTPHLTRTNYFKVFEQAMREIGTIPRGTPATQGEKHIRAFIALVKKLETCDSYQGAQLTNDDVVTTFALQRVLYRVHELSKDARHARIMRRSNPRADLHE